MFSKDDIIPGIKNISMFKNGAIKGSVRCLDSMWYDGVFEGELDVEKNLILGEKAHVIGNIKALNIIILGKVKGELNIQGIAKFGSKSEFSGRIKYRQVEVLQGALFNAECITVNDSATEFPLTDNNFEIEYAGNKMEDKIAEEISRVKRFGSTFIF